MKTLEEQLRAAGLRVTSQRKALIDALRQARKPLRADDLAERVANVMDRATVFRNLQTLVDAAIIRRLDFADNARWFELAATGHHHHIVCLSCGRIEDVDVCIDATALQRAAKASKSFTRIERHALELFGHCDDCV